MSKFNSYAVRLDETARGIFSEMQAVETAYKAAEAAKAHGPRRGNFQDPRTAAKIACLDADLAEAKAALQTARRELPAKGEKAIRTIRKELAAAIDAASVVDPAQVDNNVMELLNSGICTATDYERLMGDAENGKNVTMQRLIASYATKAAANMKDQPERARLTALAQRTPSREGAALLETFDALSGVFQRCTDNLAMIPRWGDLTADVIESF